VISAHARRAMLEHWPTLVDPSRMYRSVRWGPLLEVFFVDGRSFRTANHPVPAAEAFFGAAQLAWLEGALAASTATWKVIACNMPLGLVVSEPAPDKSGIEAFDGFANTSGAPSGRELELAHLLSSLRRRGVRNVVWLTADVHYAAAHRYDPSRAAFRDMDPFWEFVAGPMHATSFPRKRFDDTFGPELAYATAGWDTFGSPATGQQYFGVVRIDGASRVMTVTLVDGRGRDLHVTVMRPVT
jgi:alkaline phosphatase D